MTNKKNTVAEIELREYQRKIIDDVRQSIANGHKRIIIQLPVGGGKTIIAGEIARSARESKPGRYLLRRGVNWFTRRAKSLNN